MKEPPESITEILDEYIYSLTRPSSTKNTLSFITETLNIVSVLYTKGELVQIIFYKLQSIKLLYEVDPEKLKPVSKEQIEDKLARLLYYSKFIKDDETYYIANIAKHFLKYLLMFKRQRIEPNYWRFLIKYHINVLTMKQDLIYSKETRKLIEKLKIKLK